MTTPDPAAAPPPSGKRRVFVVDDHPLVREWLSSLINRSADLLVCGEAEDGPRALEAIARLRPDAAVVDLSLQVGSGLDLIKDLKIQCPATAILVLSMHDESLYAERVLRAGARGYVMKRDTTRNVLAAIRRVLEGGVYVSAEFGATMAQRLSTGVKDAPSASQLSDRELEVFRRLGRGENTSAIAADLHLSLKTVQAYCARIKEKLNLENMNELLREAVRFEERQDSSQV